MIRRLNQMPLAVRRPGNREARSLPDWNNHIDQINILAKPLYDYLRKNFNPYVELDISEAEEAITKLTELLSQAITLKLKVEA